MQAAEDRSYCPMCNAVFRTPFSRCPLDGSKLAELADDPLVGTTLDSRYLIEECIGEGGMGRVYRAKHTRMSRHYAIKVLFGDHAGDSRMRSRFAREAEAVSRLNHSNVISVLDFGETKEGLLFLVMDLALGPSLARIVNQDAPLPPARAIEILTQLSSGLAHAHGHGLVHRDFKCENVIMVIEEEVEVAKIVDFGICMIVEDSPAHSMLTSNGMIMGTPAVMAPEQASGDKVDHRTDLFSLGIVGYQMLSGCLPFEGTPLDMARKNLYEPIPSIQQRSGVQVAPEVEAIIRGLTAKKPDDRFQSAKDVLLALRNLSAPGGQLLHGDSQGWSTPAPPGELMGPTAGRTTPMGYQVQNTPAHTSMVSQMPLDSLKKRRVWPLLFLGAALAVAAGVSLVLVTGNRASEQKAAQEPAVALVTPDAQAAAHQDDATDTVDAGSVEDAATTVAALVDEKLTPETTVKGTETSPEDKDKDKDKDRGKNRNVIKRRDKIRKPEIKEPVEEPQSPLKRTLSLYATVGKQLSELENNKGKAAAADLRSDYRNISSSRLIRDSSLQPIYHQSLLRLQNQIRARSNK